MGCISNQRLNRGRGTEIPMVRSRIRGNYHCALSRSHVWGAATRVVRSFGTAHSRL
jgi:hypothetical protein